jgi:hypothetical protein
MRHKLADNDTADLNNPIPVPSSGIKYGWRKMTKLRVASGLNSQISNLRWYALTMNGTDWDNTVELYVGVTSNFITLGSASDESALLSGLTNANQYVLASPLVVCAGIVVTTTLANNGYGITANQAFVMHQIGVYANTASGVKSLRSTFYRYDEI